MTTATPKANEDNPIPFRYWWAFAFCAAALGIILAAGPYSDNVLLEPDKGNWWYFWQLANPTIWTRLSAWVPYTAHLMAMWYLIHTARYVRPRYIFGLHHFNVMALAVNAFFILLHIVQTKVFYDGLAQDTHEATSMGSVTLMLFLIYLLENKRRGIFFGKRVRFMEGIGESVKRYHGYYFSWAIIFTFWYHPVEINAGHMAGFAYMFLLLLQSSLFFTRYHTNRIWTYFLEALFVVHGAFVAAFIMNPGEHEFWSMFIFGGATLFLVTQMHGLGLSKKGKMIVAAPVVLSMVVFYSIFPEHMWGIASIPATMYAGAFITFAVLWLSAAFAGLFKRSAVQLADDSQATDPGTA